MAIGTTVSISGLELTSVGISGSVDTLITPSGTANTVPPVKKATTQNTSFPQRVLMMVTPPQEPLLQRV